MSLITKENQLLLNLVGCNNNFKFKIMTMVIKHINEITFEGKDRWTKQFNRCSEHFIKAQDQSLSEKEKEESFQLWFEERQRLELGIY